MAAKRKYRWEEWFGRRRTVLTRGVDYHCSQSSICQAVRNEAWRRGMRVHIIDDKESIVVEVTGTRGVLPVGCH